MLDVQSSGVIGTAGILAMGMLANPGLMAPFARADLVRFTSAPSLLQPYVAANADSSRANTVWVAMDASTAPSHADFQKLAISLAMQQHPLDAEFDVLLTDRFEDLLD